MRIRSKVDQQVLERARYTDIVLTRAWDHVMLSEPCSTSPAPPEILIRATGGDPHSSHEHKYNRLLWAARQAEHALIPLLTELGIPYTLWRYREYVVVADVVIAGMHYVMGNDSGGPGDLAYHTEVLIKRVLNMLGFTDRYAARIINQIVNYDRLMFGVRRLLLDFERGGVVDDKQ